jgi:hypothetical protein
MKAAFIGIPRVDGTRIAFLIGGFKCIGSMVERAKTLNGLFDEWNTQRKGLPVTGSSMPKYGTVEKTFPIPGQA